MPKKTYAKPPDVREQVIIENATHFAASCRLGVGVVERVEDPTPEGIAAKARALSNYHQKPVLIYAVMGESQAYVTTAKPQKEKDGK